MMNWLLLESGLLLTLSPDQHRHRIEGYKQLSFAKDYSGLAFADTNGDKLWVISDDSKSVYLYQPATSQIIAKTKLRNHKGKKYSSGEGIAFDPERSLLYVVTDKKHDFYRYRVTLP